MYFKLNQLKFNNYSSHLCGRSIIFFIFITPSLLKRASKIVVYKLLHFQQRTGGTLLQLFSLETDGGARARAANRATSGRDVHSRGCVDGWVGVG